jgi:hypothetical protein
MRQMFWGASLYGGPDWRSDESILDQMLTKYDYLAPGRDYAWKWLRTRYNSQIANLNTAWYVHSAVTLHCANAHVCSH